MTVGYLGATLELPINQCEVRVAWKETKNDVDGLVTSCTPRVENITLCFGKIPPKSKMA